MTKPASRQCLLISAPAAACGMAALRLIAGDLPRATRICGAHCAPCMTVLSRWEPTPHVTFPRQHLQSSRRPKMMLAVTTQPRSIAVLVLVAGLFIATFAMPAPAHAGGIVIESYVGKRAADADALLGPIKAELAAAGYSTGAKLAKQIETTLSAASVQLLAKQIATAKKFIKSGRKEYVNGRFGTAVKDFAYGVNLLFSASTTMARDQSLRATLSMGLIGLGLAHKRLGHAAKATKPVAELIRSMPDRELSRARHGPDAHALYRKVKNDLAAQGLGRLRIDADGAMVFVNERFIGVDKVLLKDLLRALPWLHLGNAYSVDTRGAVHRAVPFLQCSGRTRASRAFAAYHRRQ